MTDKRGTWSKNDRKLVWEEYISNKMWREFPSLEELDLDWNWTQAAPCPKCSKKMLKAQYQGFQPNKSYSWDIDHKNGNPHDNYLDNLQPMHPWCNTRKG